MYIRVLADVPSMSIKDTYSVQVINTPLRSAAALSVNISETSGKDLEMFRMAKFTTIGAVVTRLLARSNDLVCAKELEPKVVTLHSSRAAALALHFILIPPPRHTYSCPAGSNNCSEMAEKVYFNIFTEISILQLSLTAKIDKYTQLQGTETCYR